MSNLRGWAGLPDGLLHSIVELLGSFPNLLAFAATCHPWRSLVILPIQIYLIHTLFASSPFCPHRPFPNVARNTTVPKRPCYVIDIGSQDTLLCSPIPLLCIDCTNNPPPSALDKFGFIGASFGHMIFSSNKTCFIFDVFTGTEVLPPPLPAIGNTKFWHGAALTGPLASPNSHFIVYTEYSNFFWRDGSWSKCSPHNGSLTKFVGFVFEAYRLDPSTELAKWVKVERLKKWAIFISNDSRVQPLLWMNKERWGGRSNRVYCYDSGCGHLVAF